MAVTFRVIFCYARDFFGCVRNDFELIYIVVICTCCLTPVVNLLFRLLIIIILVCEFLKVLLKYSNIYNIML